MKSIIAAVITCAILFGVSYYASNYYANLDADDQEEVDKPEETVEPEKSTLPPDTDEIKQKPVTMQVGERPEKGVSLEAVLQMSDSIKRMEEKLLLREKRVAKEEQRINMMISDLETEQDELSAFAESVDLKVDMLNKKTQELRDLLTELAKREKEIEALAKKGGVDEDSKRKEMEDKVDQVIPWFAGLDPKQASDYLKEFANSGKMEFAAELLDRLEQRQKAKILSEMKDPVLVNQLIDSLKVKPQNGQ